MQLAEWRLSCRRESPLYFPLGELFGTRSILINTHTYKRQFFALLNWLTFSPGTRNSLNKQKFTFLLRREGEIERKKDWQAMMKNEINLEKQKLNCKAIRVNIFVLFGYDRLNIILAGN
jgi:hypothetical protein